MQNNKKKFRERNKIFTLLPYPGSKVGVRNKVLLELFETFIRLFLSIYLCIHVKTASICLYHCFVAKSNPYFIFST